MPVNKPLINFVIETDLLEKVDDFRFANRFPTRAAAIKWLLAWALKQKPSAKALPVQVADQPSRPPLPVPVAEIAEPSRQSAIQALNDQGCEVGETALHPDGKLRIAVRSKDGVAWVNVDQELADLAAGRITFKEVAARRTAGR